MPTANSKTRKLRVCISLYNGGDDVVGGVVWWC
jgi:hypothetical protein